MPDDQPDVDDLVTALLTASRVLVGVSARSLAHLDESVTVTQFRVLVVLRGHGETRLNLQRVFLNNCISLPLCGERIGVFKSKWQFTRGDFIGIERAPN